jgi:hypothetical protein
MVERPFWHTRRLQQLVEAYAGKAFAGEYPEAGFENVLTRVVVTNIHGYYAATN